MCGIYGIVGKTDTFEIINALEKLEYRGYDSCGMAYIYNQKILLNKAIGNTKELKKKIDKKIVDIAIGHTRWATHGEINLENAHPHSSIENRFYVVHNGVIENYLELKEKYKFKFNTNTDTEVIVHLLDMYNKQYDILTSIVKLKEDLKGSYAIVFIDKYNKDKLFFLKNKSPLLLAEDSNKMLLSSDQSAFDNKMRVTILNDGNYGYITNKNKNIFSNSFNEKWNTFFKESKNEYFKKNEHFMLDEIEYEPDMLKSIASFYSKININDFYKELAYSNEILFVGAGSSYYAGCILKSIYEKKLRKRCYSIPASELEYFNFLYDSTLVIFLSQSGETADLCYNIDCLKNNGYKIISLCNNVNSTLGYKSDMIFPLLANKEISVASTKAFTAMIYVGLILLDKDYINKCNYFSDNLIKVLNSKNCINNICNDISKSNNVFYLGKDIDYLIALEASLKLREITYISSFAFYFGELKHGSIALIDQNTVSIGILTKENQSKAIRSSLEEINSRGGKTYLISNIDKKADIYIDGDILSIILIIQLIAYKTALILNRNIDQPRNLAKSVTVL